MTDKTVDHSLNPAGRLFAFLQHCRAQNPMDGLRAVWANYFNAGDDPQLYAEAVGSVLALPGLSIKAIESIKDPVPSASMLNRPFGRTAEVLVQAAGSGQNVEWFRGALDETTIFQLELASETLSAHFPAGGLEQGLREQLHQRLADVLADISADPDLTPELRELMADHVLALLRLLNLYPAVGPQALVDEVDRFKAKLDRRAPDVRKRPTVANWLVRVGFAIVFTVDIVSAPLNVQLALEGYDSLITEINAPIVEDQPTSHLPEFIVESDDYEN